MNVAKRLLPILILGAGLSASAQENWPHYSVDWNDPLFQARVQGVYDWVGSGPDRLDTTDFTPVAIPFYQLGTINRDIDTFPPRSEIDPAVQSSFKPKDWVDREILINYLSSDGVITEFTFEEYLDENASADTYYLMGNIYFLLSRYDEAIESYDQAVEKFPNFKLAHKNKAYALLLVGDCAGALDAASEAVTLGEISVHIKNVQAYCAYERRDYETAAEASALSRVLDQSNHQVLRIQIQSLAELGHFGQALSLTDQIGDEAEANQLKLGILISQQRNEGSEQELLALLEIKSRLGDLDRTEQHRLTRLKIKQGLAHKIDDTELHAFFDSGAESTQYLDTALMSALNAEGPDVAASFGESRMALLSEQSQIGTFGVLLAELEQQQGNLDYAEKVLLRLLTEDALDCEALLLLSMTEYRLGKIYESDSYMERAVSSSQTCENASLEQRALFSVQKEEFGLAEAFMLRDWNQKIARGEMPDEFYIRRFRAMSEVARRTGE